jgi:2-iminobutanoate/2-iminopropanoate deaminase
MIIPAGPTLYVGGQNGIDNTGVLLDGLQAQTEQAMRNVLAEAGTGPEHVAKLTIYLAAGVDPGSAYAATRTVWGDRRTAVTVLAVTPARPGALSSRSRQSPRSLIISRSVSEAVRSMPGALGA